MVFWGKKEVSVESDYMDKADIQERLTWCILYTWLARYTWWQQKVGL